MKKLFLDQQIFYWMNGQNEKIKQTFEETIMVSTELTIYFTNVFTIEIVQRENERNRGKINYNLENINKVIFLELLKKKLTKWVVHKR